MMFFPKVIQKFAARFNLDYYRVLHSIKTAIGCLLGFFVAWYYDLPQGQWIPITIIVVMSAQAHFGGALRKAYMRFLGTVAGVAIAVVTLLLFGHSAAVIFAVVFIASLFFTYIASSGGAISYAGTLGAVTVVLTLGGTQVAVEFAIERGCYIVLGIIIALLVSRFLFPIHARDQLRLSVAFALRNLKRLYFEIMCRDVLDTTVLQSRETDNILLRAFDEQPQLIEEAVAGSRYFSAQKKELFVAVVKTERKLYRLIYFMRRILVTESWLNEFIRQNSEVIQLNNAIASSLAILADCVEKVGVAPCEIVNVENLLQRLKNVVKDLPKERDVEMLLDEHSFLFFLEQLAKEVAKLRDNITQINT